MRTMHLFAGAGGGLISDIILGHTPVCAVEWDEYACRVLRQRADEGWFPGLHVHEGDIRLFDPSPWAGRVDCIHAGFPCQDISTAGKGAGIDGERSGLFSEVILAALIIRPRYLFLENSPQIVTRGLIHVLRALAAIGYDCRWTILAAADVGAPHLRKRWWCLCKLANPCSGRRGSQEKGEMEQPGRAEIIGSSNDSHPDRLRELQPEGGVCEFGGWAGDICQEVPNPNEVHGHNERHDPGAICRERSTQAGVLADPGCIRYGVSEPEVCPGRNAVKPCRENMAHSQGIGRTPRRAGDTPKVEERGKLNRSGIGVDVRHPNGEGLEIREGQPGNDGEEQSPVIGTDWWTVEPDVGRVVDGVASRVDRVTAIGNGQVPLCAAAAWKLLGGEMKP